MTDLNAYEKSNQEECRVVVKFSNSQMTANLNTRKGIRISDHMNNIKKKWIVFTDCKIDNNHHKVLVVNIDKIICVAPAGA